MTGAIRVALVATMNWSRRNFLVVLSRMILAQTGIDLRPLRSYGGL
jgi:hypothetical protein